MSHQVLFLGILIGLVLQAADVPPRAVQGQHKTSSNAPRTLTGCVNEVNGKYVLLDGQMQKIVGLQAAASNDEAVFAKRLGHTVRVRGTMDSTGNGELGVTRIDPISGTCRVAAK
jgi:hypothetical protein